MIGVTSVLSTSFQENGSPYTILGRTHAASIYHFKGCICTLQHDSPQEPQRNFLTIHIQTCKDHGQFFCSAVAFEACHRNLEEVLSNMQMGVWDTACPWDIHGRRHDLESMFLFWYLEKPDEKTVTKRWLNRSALFVFKHLLCPVH